MMLLDISSKKRFFLMAFLFLICSFFIQGALSSSFTVDVEISNRKLNQSWSLIRGGSWGASRSMIRQTTEVLPPCSGSEEIEHRLDSDHSYQQPDPPEGYIVECKDGVCELKPKENIDANVQIPDLGTTSEIMVEAKTDDRESDEFKELLKMGWDAERISIALDAHSNDIIAAAESLAQEEERDLAIYGESIATMSTKGWDEETSLSALRKSNGDIDDAIRILENEDDLAVQQFESSVLDMVENGWDAEVARNALLMQWHKDIQRQGGGARAQKQLEKAGWKVSPKPKTQSKSTVKPENSISKESVVFDVTSANFQKTVIESPVPVLLDVYADWCGPCKQLTPVLEDMAIRGGGIFRLAKLNSEKDRSLTQLLGVEALPSVFAIRDGAIVNNFVGGLEASEMQAFMTDFIMGKLSDSNAPLKDRQLSERERQQISFRLQQEAGLSELGMGRRSKMGSKVESVLSEINLMETPDVISALKLVRTICSNAITGLSTGKISKFNRIIQAGHAYQSVLLAHPSALKTLNLAGFREKEGEEGYLILTHRNAAVLMLVQDKCDEFLKKVKNESKKQSRKISVAPIVSDDNKCNDNSNAFEPTTETESVNILSEPDTLTTDDQNTFVLVIEGMPNSSEPILLQNLSPDSTLDHLFLALNDEHIVALASLSTRAIFTRGQDGSKSLMQAGFESKSRIRAILSKSPPKTSLSKKPSATRNVKESFRPKKNVSKGIKKMKGSLYGEGGIVDNTPGKYTEHFGGGTTVTVAAEDSEDLPNENERNSPSAPFDLGSVTNKNDLDSYDDTSSSGSSSEDSE